MNRRRLLRTTAIAAGVTGIGLGGWWMWDELCWMGLAFNCQSDNLSTVAKHLRQFADVHQGRLPRASELLAVGRGAHDSYLWCRRVGLPYQWDLRVAGSRVASLDKRAVVWCPPGGHGRYVGAVVVTGGEVQVAGLTVSELRGLIPGSPDAESIAEPDPTT